MAAPPKAVKSGAPNTVAASSSAMAGQTNFAGSTGLAQPTQTNAAANNNVNARPFHRPEAFQQRRRATIPKPKGKND
jgi:hypothetical protein